MNIYPLIYQGLTNTKNIQEPVIDDYFSKLNEGNFEAVSSLFSNQGCLFPPFEEQICGKAAITQYLDSKAKGIQTLPQSGTVQAHNDGNSLWHIQGKVKTGFFTVNAVWIIQLNSEKEFLRVEVKLLAELQDLLVLKRF